jgi:ectoine hydroxylase-related dioxygenase (phytanoyl-CoA dioxygenase family)
MDEIKKDLGGTYRGISVPASSPDEQRRVDRQMERLAADGYVIVDSVLSRQHVAAIKADLGPRLTRFGRNEGLEGTRTRRLYSVLAKTRSCDLLVEHPGILRLLARTLMPNWLLSQLQAIEIHPGERTQILHHDDAFYPIPRPRKAIGAATIWALDDFTETNGATVVIPRSHLWDDHRPTDADTPIPVLMPAGSVLFFLGTLWHGGGANRSDQPRLAVSAQYCEPWARQQENMSLAIPREVVRQLTPPLRSMVGYSIHPPFMGLVDGESPLKLLE